MILAGPFGCRHVINNKLNHGPTYVKEFTVLKPRFQLPHLFCPIAPSTDAGEISLTVEETNALRAKLGLFPFVR